MKNFKRDNLLFSLCGLNCGLCTMYLGNYCPGCGGGEGNQSCKIARCSLMYDKVEHCYECREFPCKKYGDIDEYDSFITHRNRQRDLHKAKEIGIEAYMEEQIEKIEILKELLDNYNDGRRKNFYCLAVNLLELQDIRSVMKELTHKVELEKLEKKEKAIQAVNLFKDMAVKRNVTLKLNKKPGK